MFTCTCIKELLFRQLLTLFLISYLLAILLFIVSVDQTQRSAMTVDSVLRTPEEHPFSIGAVSRVELLFTGDAMEVNRNVQSNRTTGDFLALGKDAFIYSAYLDDRNEQSFVRLLALFSSASARTQSVYCHFDGHDPLSTPKKALHYELCENHDKRYGGYFYSCPIPGTVKTGSLKTVLVSLTKFGPRISVHLLSIQPPLHKLHYLNRSLVDERSNISHFKSNIYVPSTKSIDAKPLPKFPNDQISFAICVSPLFGAVSVFRVIEFIELSKLLGAHHIYFYNYSIYKDLDEVLHFYVALGQITVLPWELPSEIDPERVWYHGQLLSNNDCLYRTMPRHDLVFFNDIDEFVVPHSEAKTWAESFGTFLADDQCGLSFQSAFFDPGNFDLNDVSLVTSAITERTLSFSKVRTKVMVCPWRVFEVGIHHVSKQNREEWRPYPIDPSAAYLHHYRRCASDYSVSCYTFVDDRTVIDRYSGRLAENCNLVLKQLYSKGILSKSSS